MTEYSNFRTHAVIADWPSGGKRVTATFNIECHPKHGERATRTTTGKPKKHTYGRTVRIVDGDDGKTYVAELAREYEMITIMCGDLHYQHETIHGGDPRYDAVRKLLVAQP
jgi:hypothetical protein